MIKFYFYIIFVLKFYEKCLNYITRVKIVYRWMIPEKGAWKDGMLKRWSRGAKKIFSSRNSDPKGRWVNLKSGWHPARTHVAMVLFSTYSFCYIFYIWQLLLKAPMNGSFINEVKLVSTEYSQWNMTFTSQVNHIIRFFSFLWYIWKVPYFRCLAFIGKSWRKWSIQFPEDY